MKRPQKIIGKALLVSMLSTGVGWYVGTVAANPADNGVGYVGSSGSALLAQLYLSSDKPPYVRDTRTQEKKQLEKSEFSRLEEKPAVTEEKKQPAYCYHVPGAKPPYQINSRIGTPC